MGIKTILWLVCGVIWVLLIAGFIGLTVFNRIKNHRDKRDMQ